MWTRYASFQDYLLLWNGRLSAGVHYNPEGAPGRAEETLDLGPLLRCGIAFRDDAVAEPRRFGPQSRVLCQLIFGEMVEFRLQDGQTPIEVPGWMRFAFAVDDPPIQFPASGLRAESARH